MQRIIKFRIFDGSDMHYEGGKGSGQFNPTWVLHNKTYKPYGDYELMQFTGLLDKNGKEIYEGDIVKYKLLEGFDCESDVWRQSENIEECPPKVVEFKDGCFFPREYYHYVDDGFYAYRFFDVEVIGNIYQNPDLLK